MNRHLLSEADLRRFDRVRGGRRASYGTHFTRSTGEQVRCEVLDLSLTGVSVRSELKPAVGEHILIPAIAPGRVARHQRVDGIGIEFLGLSRQSGGTRRRFPSPVRPIAMAMGGLRPSPTPGAAMRHRHGDKPIRA